MPRRSDMILKPLLNELKALNFDEKSPLFETFKNTSIEFAHESEEYNDENGDEGEILIKELEKMKQASQQNILKSQENVKLMRRNSMIELESLINIYKNDMALLKEEIAELKRLLQSKDEELLKTSHEFEISEQNLKVLNTEKHELIENNSIMQAELQKMEDYKVQAIRKGVLIEEIEKRLEGKEEEFKGINQKIEGINQALLENKGNLIKALNVMGNEEMLDEKIKEAIEDRLQLIKTTFKVNLYILYIYNVLLIIFIKEIEENVRDATVKFMNINDEIVQIRYNCISVPKDAEAIRQEILPLREENEKLKEVNAQHEVEREELLKEIEVSENSLQDTKKNLAVISRNLNEIAQKTDIESKEYIFYIRNIYFLLKISR